eukprot:6484316-Amphidinium_carterae.1
MDLGLDGDDDLSDDPVGEVAAPECTLSIDDSAAKQKSSSGCAVLSSSAAPAVLDLVDESLPTVSRRRSSAGSLVEVVDEQPASKVARKAKPASRDGKGLVVLE